MYTEIKRYTYYVWSSRTQAVYQPVVAAMMLYDAANNYVASLEFREDDTLPLARKEPSTSVVFLAYRIRELPAIVDMLRHEKPVYVSWDDGPYAGLNACLTTGKEPVGEEERLRGPLP